MMVWEIAELSTRLTYMQDMLHIMQVLQLLKLKMESPMLLEMDNKGAADFQYILVYKDLGEYVPMCDVHRNIHFWHILLAQSTQQLIYIQLPLW